MHKAIALYQKYGIQAVRPDYYHNHEDAYLDEKEGKRMVSTAIESSCDEMAVAILKDQRELLCNVVASQIDTHRLFGGVVPEIASRMM